MTARGNCEANWLDQERFFGDAAGISTLPKPRREAPGLPIRVRIVRNHPVELTARLMERFGRYLGLSVRAEISDYDDTFSFATGATDADALLIWPDWRRIDATAVSRVIDGMAGQAQSAADVRVVAPHPQEVGEALAAQVVSRLVDAGLPLYPDRWVGPLIRRDPRLESVAGSDISIESHFWLARDLTVGWLASLRCPPLKAVAVDLDNTLYHGVLGEVGHAGVEFTGDHVSLLDALGRLARQGVLICVVTRNDQRDLASLAQVWPQGGFTLDGAAIVSASWEDKATVIQRMAADLATEPSSMMFVDDNPGELVRAISGNPGLWPVLADSPTQVVALLETQRHRASSSSDTTGGARAADARALEERSRHADASHSMQDLHERLRTRISARVATQDDVPRVEDLLKRTNQFNLTLRRTGVKDIDDARRRPDREVLVAAVSDDLSDSGLVAVMIVTLSERRLEIDELAISCRVLGRDLETALVVSMLDCLEPDAAGLELRVPVVHGPRNEPALIWLSTVAAAGIDGLATASVDAQDLRTLSSDILSVVAGPEAVGRDDA